jgi:hypothetical protein
MTLILWAGKNGEMLFNRRRCSQDRAVIADILAQFPLSDICVSAYSAPLFEGARVISQLTDAKGRVLFLEDLPLSPALALAKKLIVYRFDRIYPANVRLQIPPIFTLTESRELTGYSHDKITREVYEK